MDISYQKRIYSWYKMTVFLNSLNSNTMGVTNETGSVYLSGSSDLVHNCFLVGSVLQIVLWNICWTLVFCSFDHCIVCSSSSYNLSLQLWYLQTFLIYFWQILISRKALWDILFTFSRTYIVYWKLKLNDRVKFVLVILFAHSCWFIR